MIFLAIGLWILFVFQLIEVASAVYKNGKQGKAKEAALTVVFSAPLVAVVFTAALVIGGLV